MLNFVLETTIKRKKFKLFYRIRINTTTKISRTVEVTKAMAKRSIKKNIKNTRRPIKSGVRKRRSITKNTTDTVIRPIMKHSMSLSQLLPLGSIWRLSMKSKLSAEFYSLRDLINRSFINGLFY